MDPGDAIQLIVLLILIMLSAFFSSAETSLTTVNKIRILSLVDEGNKTAKILLRVIDNPGKLLSTILIGNNIFHAACASLSALLVLRQFSEEYVVYGTIITTVIVYLFAEMLPKSLAKARSEEIALIFASSMQLFVRILTPVSFFFSGISKLLSRFFTSDNSATVTEEDLVTIIETIEDEGVLSPETQALVNSAMEFREKLARDIMIPIDQVDAVSSGTPLKKLASVLRELSYSRVPVYEGKRENIVGILPVNTFLSAYVSGKPILLRKMLLKPYVFDEKTEITTLLQRMRLNKLHMVFICDENRNKVGLITMEDLLEELVGEIQDESDAGEGLVLS